MKEMLIKFDSTLGHKASKIDILELKEELETKISASSFIKKSDMA